MAPTAKRNTDFRRKIKTPHELAELLGLPPRKKSVVMCHGVFDIVHPGHLRHLMYAKERADILIASITCDDHICKANLRPYVPQDLRAMNLAAIECVDYVVIDPHPSPIEHLKIIKPDYFAKGFEYQNGGVHPKTREEISVLESYGGDILFTPGDVVYSSSKIIESQPPDLKLVKLATLMENEGVTFDDLRVAITKMEGLRVHVVGDTIVDSYTHCGMTGGMTKTPTISVQFQNQIDFAGGAAVVSKHLRRAGAEVTFSTVLGEDTLRNFVIEDLEKAGITCDPYIDKTRPTTQKNVFIAQGYHLLRVGKLDNRPISEKTLEYLSRSLSRADVDAVVFSDFRHGIFNRTTIPQLVKNIPDGVFRAADSQVASRWGNILEFEGFDLITPNEREARFALGDQDSVVRPLAFDLYKKARCKILMLKLGERGMLTYRENSLGVGAFFTVDAFADSLVDGIGSGDALLSYSTLALVATKSEAVASIVGSFAAGVACEREGNHPVAPEDVLKKIDVIEQSLRFSNPDKQRFVERTVVPQKEPNKLQISTNALVTKIKNTRNAHSRTSRSRA